MIVQFKRKNARYPDLSARQDYLVIGIEADDLRILNDRGRPYLYPATIFKVVDRAEDADWQVTVGEDGEKYAYARPLKSPGFFEDFFDSKPKAVSTFWHVVNRHLAAAG